MVRKMPDQEHPVGTRYLIYDIGVNSEVFGTESQRFSWGRSSSVHNDSERRMSVWL